MKEAKQDITNFRSNLTQLKSEFKRSLNRPDRHKIGEERICRAKKHKSQDGLLSIPLTTKHQFNMSGMLKTTADNPVLHIEKSPR